MLESGAIVSAVNWLELRRGRILAYWADGVEWRAIWLPRFVLGRRGVAFYREGQ